MQHDPRVLRSQFHAKGESAYLDTVRTNAAYQADDVKAFITVRAQGFKAARPQAVAFDPAKPDPVLAQAAARAIFDAICILKRRP